MVAKLPAEPVELGANRSQLAGKRSLTRSPAGQFVAQSLQSSGRIRRQVAQPIEQIRVILPPGIRPLTPPFAIAPAAFGQSIGMALGAIQEVLAALVAVWVVAVVGTITDRITDVVTDVITDTITDAMTMGTTFLSFAAIHSPLSVMVEATAPFAAIPPSEIPLSV